MHMRPESAAQSAGQKGAEEVERSRHWSRKRSNDMLALAAERSFARTTNDTWVKAGANVDYRRYWNSKGSKFGAHTCMDREHEHPQRLATNW
jgi:hypothetical protein